MVALVRKYNSVVHADLRSSRHATPSWCVDAFAVLIASPLVLDGCCEGTWACSWCTRNQPKGFFCLQLIMVIFVRAPVSLILSLRGRGSCPLSCSTESVLIGAFKDAWGGVLASKVHLSLAVSRWLMQQENRWRDSRGPMPPSYLEGSVALAKALTLARRPLEDADLAFSVVLGITRDCSKMNAEQWTMPCVVLLEKVLLPLPGPFPRSLFCSRAPSSAPALPLLLPRSLFCSRAPSSAPALPLLLLRSPLLQQGLCCGCCARPGADRCGVGVLNPKVLGMPGPCYAARPRRKPGQTARCLRPLRNRRPQCRVCLNADGTSACKETALR